MSVTDVALDANYGSLEAFTRAFRKAFRTSPSIYRRVRDPHFHLPASNKLHFFAPGSSTKGGRDMDLFDRLPATTPGPCGVCWNTRVLRQRYNWIVSCPAQRTASLAGRLYDLLTR